MNKLNPDRLLLNIVFSIILLISFSPPAVADKRVALVIGNSDYKDSPLNNPVNDAIDITAALKKTGFEVDYYTNINRKQMREAIRKFGDKLRQADTGLFYFAGHGIQIKGRNYLIPLAVDVQAADEVEDESIDANAVLRKMETAGNAVNIVILDACRNNPFARSFRSLDRGLARMDGPVGSFIAYATAPGSVAADGTGRNGLYTQYLLEALAQPGLSIEQVFKRVRNNVKNVTSGQQIPWESSSLMGEFMFLNGKQTASSSDIQTAPPAPPAVAFKYLQVIANVPNAEVIVNNVNRGLTGNQGALNIANLTSNEAEVTVKAEGYAAQKQRVRLKDGQWEQLYVSLQPLTDKQTKNIIPPLMQEAKSGKQSNCHSGKRLLLNSKLISQLGKQSKTKHNPANIQASIMNSFDGSGIEFINFKTLLKQFSNNQNKKHLLKTLAEQHKVDYLLKATINLRERPVKLLKTNMKTVSADMTLKLIELKTHRILASVVRSFNKAGMDPRQVLQKQLQQQLPTIAKELLKQACQTAD